MTVRSTLRKAALPAHLRACLFVVAALLFSQFASVSHAHDAHDESPVACDVCPVLASEDDGDGHDMEDEPRSLDPVLGVVPASLTLQDSADAPRFTTAGMAPAKPDKGRSRPRQTRAPPL